MTAEPDLHQHQGEAPRTRKADALFVLIGANAKTNWRCADGLQRDEDGYVCTGRDLEFWQRQRRPPFLLETSFRGFFVRATCAMSRSNACRTGWAREAWRSRSFSSTWRFGAKDARPINTEGLLS